MFKSASSCTALLLPILIGGAPICVVAGSSDTHQPMLLSRVELFPAGQGVFEYESKNTGDTELSLQLRTVELDDVLKSLVLKGFDSARIEYKPEKDDAESVDPRYQTDATQSRAEILQGLQGSRVTVNDEKVSKSGTIVSVELQVQLTPNGEQEYEVLTLSTAQGLEQIRLSQQTNVAFSDPNTKEKFDLALQQLKPTGNERATVILKLKKHVVGPAAIAYQTETAPWKCSYRIAEVENQFQWIASAVIDNHSGVDWKDIELVLIIDQPLGFKSALSEVQFAHRDSIAVPSLFSATPPLLAAGRRAPVGPKSAGIGLTHPAEDPFSGGGYGGMGGMGGMGMGGMAMGMGAPGASNAVAGKQETIENSADPLAKRLGMSFTIDSLSGELSGNRVHIRIPNVTILSGESQTVFLPKIPQKIRQLSVHVSGMNRKHPLAAFEVTPLDGYQSLAGPGTVWSKKGYMGDVMFPRMVSDTPQLVTYSVDDSLTISQKPSQPQSLPSSWEIVKLPTGNEFRQTTRLERVLQYSIENSSNEPKTVVIEHTERDGKWKSELGSGSRVGTNDEIYRYETVANANATTTFDILESQTRYSDWQPATPLPQLADLKQRKDLPPDVLSLVESWIRVHEKRREVEEKVASLDLKIRVQQEIIDNNDRQQRRLQDLMKSLVRGDDLHTRYINRMSSLEDEIEQATAEIRNLKLERNSFSASGRQ
jgi:hypothetical protein